MGDSKTLEDELHQLREMLDPLSDLDLIKSFKTNFKELIRKEKFDLIITHKGKGTNFYNFLNNDLGIEHKSDMFIQEEDIKGNKILFFDDAVRTGKTIKKSIKKILNNKPSKLTVACLLVTSDSLEKINKDDIKKYDFRLLGLVVPSKLYDLIYRRIFFSLIGKMDYILEGHPEFVLDLKLINDFNFKTISKIIKSKIITEKDDIFEVPFLENHDGISKYTIHFDENPLKFIPPIKTEIFMSKIRMWVYFNDENKIRINIKPIVHPQFKEDIKKCSESYDFCLKKKKVNDDRICQKCVTYKYCQELGDFFYKKLGEELTNLNIEWNVEEKLPYEK